MRGFRVVFKQCANQSLWLISEFLQNLVNSCRVLFMILGIFCWKSLYWRRSTCRCPSQIRRGRNAQRTDRFVSWLHRFSYSVDYPIFVSFASRRSRLRFTTAGWHLDKRGQNSKEFYACVVRSILKNTVLSHAGNPKQNKRARRDLS